MSGVVKPSGNPVKDRISRVFDESKTSSGKMTGPEGICFLEDRVQEIVHDMFEVEKLVGSIGSDKMFVQHGEIFL